MSVCTFSNSTASLQFSHQVLARMCNIKMNVPYMTWFVFTHLLIQKASCSLIFHPKARGCRRNGELPSPALSTLKALTSTSLQHVAAPPTHHPASPPKETTHLNSRPTHTFLLHSFEQDKLNIRLSSISNLRAFTYLTFPNPGSSSPLFLHPITCLFCPSW